MTQPPLKLARGDIQSQHQSVPPPPPNVKAGSCKRDEFCRGAERGFCESEGCQEEAWLLLCLGCGEELTALPAETLCSSPRWPSLQGIAAMSAMLHLGFIAAVSADADRGVLSLAFTPQDTQLSAILN